MDYEKSYQHSEQEKKDLVAFYVKSKGDVRDILQHIIASTNEDIPRFISFFDQNKDKQIDKYRSNFEKTKDKIKKMKEEIRDNGTMLELQQKIRNRERGAGLLELLENKYCRKKVMKKVLLEKKTVGVLKKKLIKKVK